ncbi:MAG: response regulator, partial [Proteobacteria bacterium]|nr:response regulator [Pseudomonadota bacterium]
IESEAGVGSSFHFTIPVKLPFHNETTSATEVTWPAALAVDLTRTRVLLVEDDADMQYLGKRFLDEYGITSDVATNGEEALEKLQNAEFDMILMDIQMPRMDGLEATRMIRSGEYPGVNREIPIVAMTAHAMRGDRERFLAAGMNDYIAKPIDEADLVALLRSYTPRKLGD